MPYKDPQKRIEYERRWREKNRERWLDIARKARHKRKDKARVESKLWAKSNPDKILAATKKWQEANPEKVRAARKRWYEGNTEKACASSRRWSANNPVKNRERAAAYRAGRGRATPQWVNRDDIVAIYSEAVASGLTVDHIVPLKHPLVCGLHVPWNLQLLTHSENASKGNRFEIK